MRALVVYDSFFGNTEQIARAIGNALGSPDHVQVSRVSELKPAQLAGLDLVLVGSPTRGFRPTPAIAEWIKSIPADGLQRVRVTAFDTRIATTDIGPAPLRIMVKLGGYAATPIAEMLKKKGGDLFMPPEGFFVKGEQGPLKEGELGRAADWARRCQSEIAPARGQDQPAQ